VRVLAEAELRLGVVGVGLAADSFLGGSTGKAGPTHGGGLRPEPLPPAPPAGAVDSRAPTGPQSQEEV
jgi:hypothetical protein